MSADFPTASSLPDASDAPDGHVLIAGGGLVGSALAAELRAAGSRVTVWVRSEESAREVAGEAVDLEDAEAVARAAERIGRVDAVVACASTRGGDEAAYRRLYVGGTRHLLVHFGSARFILTGSTSVYGQRDGSVVTESDETRPAAATSQVLLEAEQLVLKTGGIVLRLGGLYSRERWIAREKFLAGTARLEEEHGDYLNLIHRNDAVSALLLLIEAPQASGIYNATDGHPITRLELYTALAGYYGKPLPPPAPPGQVRRRGRSHKRVQSPRLTALGWSPTFPHIKAALEAGE